MNATVAALLGLICVVGGVAIGYAIAMVGTWARVHHQESNIRALVNDIDVMVGAGDPVPPEWVQDQLETMLRKEFR